MDNADVSKKNRPRLFSRDVNNVVTSINKKMNDEKLNETRDAQPTEDKKNASNKNAVRKNN